MNMQMKAKRAFFHSAKMKSINPLPDRSLECSENIFKINGKK